jgi:FAD:protein FMN transferase
MASTDQPTRRDFLQGRVVAGLVGGVVRIFTDDSPAGPSAGEPVSAISNGTAASASRPLLTKFCRRAMACEFAVQLAAAEAGNATDSVLTALDLVEALEEQLTVYRDESELIRLNRRAAERPIVVENRLFALLKMAARLHRETNGALDLTTSPLSEAWGFSRRAGRLPSDEEIAAALKQVGMQNVVLDATNRSVAFRQRGLSLQLNCIGKGYALDRMAELLTAADIGDYLLHGGSSSVLARGQSTGSQRPGWTIGIPHPLQPGQRLAEIDLVDGALGTSGSATQSFEYAGERYGHLFDPRTGRPVTGIYTATVIAPTAAEADALSTAFYVMGPEQASRFCAPRPELAALFVCPADTVCPGDLSEVRLITHGLDESRWRVLAKP